MKYVDYVKITFDVCPYVFRRLAIINDVYNKKLKFRKL